MVNLYCTADTITAGNSGGQVASNELAALRSLGTPVTILDGSTLDCSQGPFYTDYMAEARVSEILKVDKIGIAHFYAGTFGKTVQTLRQAGVHVTYTAAAHDIDISREEYRKLDIQYAYDHMTDPVKFNMHMQGYREANMVICPSNLSADIIKKYGCTNVKVIPHGITSPEEHLIKSPPKTFTVGYLGQTGPDKGWIYLIQAWKELGYTDARLVMAGSRISQIIPYIRAFSGGCVHLMGYVDKPSDLYNACTVYVQPSATEGFGIEIGEAMAHGRVVIASDGAGASELITNTYDGFVIPSRNIKALADRINWCKSNTSTLQSIGDRAKNRMSKMTWKDIQVQYANYWKRAIQPAIQTRTESD